MSENSNSFVTYNKEHEAIVKAGIDSIIRVLSGGNTVEKRGLLFCLDKYLDPYFGYNLPYFEDIIFLLQKQLLIEANKDVKEGILQLLTDYAQESLDYLADKIGIIDPDLLAGVLYALHCTFNSKYIPVFTKYKNHDNTAVMNTAKEALAELLKQNDNVSE